MLDKKLATDYADRAGFVPSGSSVAEKPLFKSQTKPAAEKSRVANVRPAKDRLEIVEKQLVS